MSGFPVYPSPSDHFHRNGLSLWPEYGRVTTDGLDSYPRAIRDALGDQVTHRTNRYLNNHIEQDHRGIKQRYWPMLGFKSFLSASWFCQAFDEVRNLFRFRTCRSQKVSLGDRRRLYQESFAQFMVIDSIRMTQSIERLHFTQLARNLTELSKPQ